MPGASGGVAANYLRLAGGLLTSNLTATNLAVAGNLTATGTQVLLGAVASHGPLRLFSSLGAAMDDAKAMAEAKVDLDARVEIYSWSNGREQKIFDSSPRT